MNDNQKKNSSACDGNRNQDDTSNTEEPKYTKEDLIDLIRAVKFSNPNASIRNVHTEIQTKMSQNESFEFLENVKLNDVKKVWKKAITGATKDTSNSTSSSTSSDAKSKNGDKQSMKSDSDNIMNDIKQSKGGKGGILKFYTVGDGSVKTLAKNYTLQAAALAAAQQRDPTEEQNEEEMKKYVSCFLDVPADRSGGKPHQALINFNDNNKKKNKLSKKGSSNSADNRDIVKIQVAAPLPGMENSPMLLYNADRSAKTFIHDDKDDENRGYEKIKQMINTHGVSGALSGGGTKAYFYSHITRRQGEQDLVSIDISQLATPQKW